MLQHGEPAHPVPGELTAGVPADVRARGDHLGRVPHPDRVLALGQTAVSGQDSRPIISSDMATSLRNGHPIKEL